jgi:hypothetical protein
MQSLKRNPGDKIYANRVITCKKSTDKNCILILNIYEFTTAKTN